MSPSLRMQQQERQHLAAIRGREQQGCRVTTCSSHGYKCSVSGYILNLRQRFDQERDLLALRDGGAQSRQTLEV